MDFSTLSPHPVWRHFQTLCEIPRASKAEGPLRQALQAWARARGLATHTDAAGNLLIKKPASAGREGYPAVVLQGHLDMVCQKNSGTAHDFEHDAIAPALKERKSAPVLISMVTGLDIARIQELAGGDYPVIRIMPNMPAAVGEVAVPGAVVLSEAEVHHSLTFTIPYSRIQLADYLNCDRSALSRELSLMQRDGLLETYRSSFKLLEPEALRRMVL